MSATYSPAKALRWFGFRQTLRAVIIIGVLSGFMLAIQGIAYNTSFPTEASRAKFASSLSAAPALGFLYGDAKNLMAGTTGYMFYRVTAFIGLITAIWGTLAATRLLRGSEEDGRWEPVRSGVVTARAATAHVMTGMAGSWLLGFTLSLLVTLAMCAPSHIGLSFGTALVFDLLMFLPGLLFATIGIFTSQLGLTRHRALMYGLAPLIALFLVRGVGNTKHSLHWLMTLSPFGWIELVNPIIARQYIWLVPFAVFAVVFAVAGVLLAKRDLGASIIKQSQTSRSHFYLLANGWQLALRQNAWTFASWAAAALGMTALMASLATIAVNVTSDSQNISNTLSALAGNKNDLQVAFLGAGLIFLVMLLMIMATTVIGAIRGDEAKQYLDSILVNPHKRTTWLAQRLVLGVTAILLVALAAGLITYGIGRHQDIVLNFGKVIATSLSVMGTVVFLLGLGALIYGLLPRLATPIMYLVFGWSFLIILLSSAMHLSSVVLHSSLFHYTSFNLADWPDWATLYWLVVLGFFMAVAGVVMFNRRDIITE